MFQDGAKVRMDAALGPSKGKQNVHADLKLTPALSGHVKLTSIAFAPFRGFVRSEEHTSELQSHLNLVCRLLLEKKKKTTTAIRQCICKVHLRSQPLTLKVGVKSLMKTCNDCAHISR